MALKLLHEYTTIYRVVADIRMLNTYYQTLMSRYKAILNPINYELHSSRFGPSGFFLQKLQNVFKINDHNDSGYCYTHFSMQFADFTKLKSKFK